MDIKILPLVDILEEISDEPRDPEPYLAYALDWQRGHRVYWRGLPQDHTTDCVIGHIDLFIRVLENLQRKLRRARAEKV